jgi:hypothetical protein
MFASSAVGFGAGLVFAWRGRTFWAAAGLAGAAAALVGLAGSGSAAGGSASAGTGLSVMSVAGRGDPERLSSVSVWG